ncbi:MAG: cyclodeaminase/cyclohydrolase family protein [Desulfobacteraceae bacterium]|nr:cyclodeaminase/cyclohydrolase family protein [Desulfobacteraceae bacterium]
MQLAELSIREFIDELGAGTPFPGGGAVAALCGSLAAALSTMVSALTLGKEKFKAVWEDVGRAGESAAKLKRRFLDLAQEDTDAYSMVMAAYRLPKGSEDEKSARAGAIEEAMKFAAGVPLETLKASGMLIEVAAEVLEKGNPNTLTDAGAALHLSYAAAVVAAANVRINLPAIRDVDFVENYNTEVAACMERVERCFEEGVRYLNSKLP